MILRLTTVHENDSPPYLRRGGVVSEERSTPLISPLGIHSVRSEIPRTAAGMTVR